MPIQSTFPFCCPLRGITLTAALLLVSACGGGGGGAPGAGPTPDVPADTSPWGLHATTEAGLTTWLREALGATDPAYMRTPWALNIAAAADATAPAAAGGQAVFSGTTLQEAGVDEADLIKSDGTAVFSLEFAGAGESARKLLRRQRLDPSAADAPLIPGDSLQLPFSAGVRGTGLYLDSDRQQVAAIGEAGFDWGIYDAWFAPRTWEQGVTEVALVSAASPTALQTRRTLRMTGQLIGSRRVGATLYLVLRSYPQVPALDALASTGKTPAMEAVLNSLQASQLLPTLSIDGGAATPLVQASACLVQDQNAVKSADIITVVGIDLAAAGHRHAARCFTGGTEAFYMSDRSLYLATTRNTYHYSGAFPVYPAQGSTDVHKFALNGLDIAYRGSGNVTGHLGFDQNRKSFRMGEHNGALRVITQTDEVWGGWIRPVAVATNEAVATTATVAPIESPARLTILLERNGTLAKAGELPNTAHPQPLGKPGEQLYASRFIGNRGYLVTYRLTDPLYVLDLSNPADPRVAGELEVSGYSDYLFPLSETLLLGVGKDALSDGSQGDGRFAWYQGVKVSLIDVSDAARPREAARSIIGRRGTDATVLRDHHGIALQTVGGTVRVSLPVSLHDTPPSGATGAASDYYQYTRTELRKLEVNLGAQTLTTRPALTSSLPAQRDISFDRSLLWNNQVHWYQNGSWRSAAW